MRSLFQAPTSSKSRGYNRISGFSAEADECLSNLTWEHPALVAIARPALK
ncbi:MULTISPECIES: hypothetical protein [unclassified Microcoleus]